jgi:hypothetical protein
LLQRSLLRIRTCMDLHCTFWIRDLIIATIFAVDPTSPIELAWVTFLHTCYCNNLCMDSDSAFSNRSRTEARSWTYLISRMPNSTADTCARGVVVPPGCSIAPSRSEMVGPNPELPEGFARLGRVLTHMFGKFPTFTNTNLKRNGPRRVPIDRDPD